MKIDMSMMIGLVLCALRLLVVSFGEGVDSERMDIHENTAMDQHVEQFVVDIENGDASFTENIYLLYDANSNYCVIIDPGAESPLLEEFIESRGLRVKAILNTHGHFDHVDGNGYLRKKYSCDVYGNKEDKFFYYLSGWANMPTEYFPKDGFMQFGNIEIRVIFTPGHSPGSVCFLIDGYLFSGDTLFKGTIGRTISGNGMTAEENTELLIRNVRERLLVLPDDTPVLPGHEDITTIGQERESNPFLQEG